jgi:hypothetical protein
MALTATNVRVGVSGEVSVGPTSATAPATAAATLTGFTGLGYISSDGLKRKPEASRDDIVAWQNGATVRTVTKDAKTTYKFTLIETSKANVEFAFGTTVTQSATEGTYTADPAATGGRKSFVFDVIDGANLKREYVAEGELTELGEITNAGGEPIAYECTVTGYSVPVIKDTALKTP